ncbi:MAG: succinate dehydrogenase/fumarate reductase iron-sulfur subunit [Firmicutes bacterium ADurb.Bin419]|nr:MAG: succinate dehydrogenase/fumarate reductase iron-sulfur subunit [Firmicutes bacterium ADurb.Bin419]
MNHKGIEKEVLANEKYLLFRSCAVSNKYPGIEAATKAVCSKLDILIDECDDQSCCGGSAFIFTAMGQITSTMLMSARNLAISEERNLDMLAMCNGCYKNLNEFGKYISQNPDVMNAVNEKLGEINKEFKGNSKVHHVLELLFVRRQDLKQKVVKPLRGMKFAVHYGCHYSFGAKECAIDDPFRTAVMEEIIINLGGECVKYAEEKTCCGSGILNNSYIQKEQSIPAAMIKLESLKGSGADAVIVMCPYCMMTLDRMQFQMKMNTNRDYSMPVLHIAQLAGLALGASPVELGLDSNLTNCEALTLKLEAMNA